MIKRPYSIVQLTAMMLIGAVAITVLLTVVVASVRGGQAIESLAGRNIGERLEALVALCHETPPQNRRDALLRLDTAKLRSGWSQQPLVSDSRAEDGLARSVAEYLRAALPDHRIHAGLRYPGPPTQPPPPPTPIDAVGTDNAPPSEADTKPPYPGRRHGLGMFGIAPGPMMGVSIQLRDGTWLNAVTPPHHGDKIWGWTFIWALILLLVMICVAVFVMARLAARPFQDFAAAAKRLGVDILAPPMPETGPKEVREAAIAFNQMQSRIQRFVDDRTQMLAAISHDLRTPITRMRLRAEFIDQDDERDKMLADLDDMEKMIAATLTFARDNAGQEDRQSLDIAALVQGIADDVGASYDGPDSLVVLARPLALKRAFSNVMENAIKYGQTAMVSVEQDQHCVRVIVRDHGPGIPLNQQEQVFTPFVRLENSRNRDTGGTGLGLTIARAALRAHGGDIALHNLHPHGLQVTLSLPKEEKIFR